MDIGAYQYVPDIGGYIVDRGKVYVNDAATWDSNAVLQTYPGLDNWSDTSIDMQNVIDTTGLSGQLYVLVETATGAVASRAITVSSGGSGGSARGVLRGIGRGIG